MNRSPEIVAALRDVIEAAPRSELPSIVGSIAELQASALARLISPYVSDVGKDTESDELLTLPEAAALLNMSERWVRNHGEDFGRVRFGRSLRFSRRRIEAVIKRKSYAAR